MLKQYILNTKMIIMNNFDIINELISYHVKKVPGNFLAISFDILGKDKLTTLIKNLLLWQKMVYTSPTMANKSRTTNKDFYLVEDDIIIGEYKLLFEACSELNNFFIIKIDRIVLNPELSKKEIEKLRMIIDEGYQLSIKVNVGKLKL
ncbi:hypothetical protein SAMN05421594_3749 [Chryseobacterium oleae]|uniref:Uncharacterized protein n=2 Tax=Chryseobacterium oleae TaxID=491207 RepID=A0A1I5AWV5_CHROL|nr:hypothetical protein SAMN05421594_3749 [Chryseobacterium oleae]